MIILGIETSCDETSAAVVKNGREILSNIIFSQEVHRKYGGVVPELASREHIKRIVPIMRDALDQAGLTLAEIDGFAATYGPGLVGALLVGLSFGKSLAYCNDKPFYAINHLEGHIAANFLAHPDLEKKHITLLVSGGHTMLIEVAGFGNYAVLGKTLDDAAGEAFDKVAKLLDLGYPGGPALNKLARNGNNKYFEFPRAVSDPNRLAFSYSGLKTAVALHIRRLSLEEKEIHRADIAASFQEAAVDLLVSKSLLALKKTGHTTLAVSGGVAANSRLREKLCLECERRDIRTAYPPSELCTDNAAMIAAAGSFYHSAGKISSFAANAVPYQTLE